MKNRTLILSLSIGITFDRAKNPPYLSVCNKDLLYAITKLLKLDEPFQGLELFDKIHLSKNGNEHIRKRSHFLKDY